MKQFMMLCKKCGYVGHIQSKEVDYTCPECRTNDTVIHFCNYNHYKQVSEALKSIQLTFNN